MGIVRHFPTELCNEHLSCVLDPIKLLAERQLEILRDLLGLTEYGVLVPSNYKMAMILCRDWLNKELNGTGWTVSEPDLFRIFSRIVETTKY